jgi:hypothetical protein
MSFTRSLRKGSRVLAFTVGLLLMAGVSTMAQTMMPLPAHGSVYTAAQVRGYWFTAPTDFMIVGVRVPTDGGMTGAQSVQVLRMNSPITTWATMTTDHTSLGLWTNVAGTAVIPCMIPVSAGQQIVIMGSRASGTSNAHSYATPAGPAATTIMGMPATLTRVVYQSGTYPMGAIAEEPGGQIARVEMYYAPPYTGPNDAGIYSIDSPLDFCAGNHDVKVTLTNFGSNALTTAIINWSINGVTQTPVNWSGYLDTLNQTTRRTSVTLGNRMFASGVSYTIQAYTTMPNGVVDTVLRNDTTTVTRKAAISGTYTIGGVAPDYPSFSAAIADLNANGVCGPVVFNVRTGVYTEQVSIDAVSGTSATNTITFQSETGNKADVTLTFNSNSSTTPHTLLLNGADWIRVRNMTIQGTGVSYARVVTLQGGASNNIFEGNTLQTNPTTSTSNYLCNVYCYYTNDHNNEFVDNDMFNGGYATYIYGSGTTTLLSGWKMIDNRIQNFYYMGLVMWYMDAPEVRGNWIRTNNTYTNYGFYSGYLQNKAIVNANRIDLIGTSGTKYGLYYYYYTAQPGNEALITNNMVTVHGGTASSYGIYSYYSNNGNVDFNTVYVRSTGTSSRALYSYYGSNIRYTNNIFHTNSNGYVMYFYNTTLRGFDYNVLYNMGGTFAYWNGANYANLGALQTGSNLNLNSISKPLTFRDAFDGDLHLAGASQNDVTITGVLQPYVTHDIDNDPRILPYRGADEACYILPNTVTYRFVDGENQDVTYANIPGTINVNINVAFPDMGFPLQVTVNFYTVPGNQLAYTTSFSATKLPGQTLTGTYQVAVPPTLQPGYYRMNVVFNTQNSCGDYINYNPGDKGLLLVGQGQTPCIVWPGDVTNDGIVNYGDRAALNKYIFDANLRASWLTGPARYRADYAINPMTYFTWEGQAGAPWQTPDGCYMDADGNGMVNNFDLLPVKVNFLRTNGSYVPKQDETSIAGTFGMTQNYPNPFNPSTTLQYAVPEKSTVKITVSDMIGRVVAVLVDGEVEAGVRTVAFDASALESGVYMARYEATGIASGIASSRIVKMTLAK